MRLPFELLLAVTLACGGDSLARDGDASDGEAGCSLADAAGFVIATDQNYPNGIAFDGERVFWSTSRSIMSGSLCGDVTVIAEEAGIAVAVDPTSVYWTTQTAVRAAPRSGGAPMTLTTTPPPDALTNLALDDMYVYYGSPAGVVRVLKSGESSGTVLESTYPVQWALAVDATTIYFSGGANGLMMIPKNGGSPSMLAVPTGPEIGVIALDATNVYWATTDSQSQDPVDDWTILRTPKVGGATTILASQESPISSSTGLVVDATFAYWSNDAEELRDVPIGGGSPSSRRSSGLGASVALSGSVIVWSGYFDGEVGGMHL